MNRRTFLSLSSATEQIVRANNKWVYTNDDLSSTHGRKCKHLVMQYDDLRVFGMCFKCLLGCRLRIRRPHSRVLETDVPARHQLGAMLPHVLGRDYTRGNREYDLGGQHPRSSKHHGDGGEHARRGNCCTA